MEGIIYKGIGGFYYVMADEGQVLECRARGVLRKRGQKPVAGDRVCLGSEADTEYIDAIMPRKNLFIRPPVANVDRFFVVASTTEPAPSFLVIDKLLAVALDQGADAVLVVSKPDLESPKSLQDAYRTSGIPVVVVCADAGEGLDELRPMLKDRLSVFCGNSGVGKSTLLNALAPNVEREVGEISKKLGRGRHTTREVELFEAAGGLVADTPGFASFDVQSAGEILADNLQLCFPEIKARIGQCKFSGCAHTAEKGCAVLDAVEKGEIAKSRWQSYKTLYEEARQAEREY